MDKNWETKSWKDFVVEVLKDRNFGFILMSPNSDKVVYTDSKGKVVKVVGNRTT